MLLTQSGSEYSASMVYELYIRIKGQAVVVEFLYLELTTPIISEQRGLYLHIQSCFYGF